jgi:hypothetical protein
MSLEGVLEEQRTFDAMQSELVRSAPGRFAVVCGPRLLGVFDSVDAALLASSRAFDTMNLPEGAPLLISEIAENVSVRVVARPYTRTAPATKVVTGKGAKRPLPGPLRT